MIEKMKAMPMSGNMDKDYVSIMLAHHQNAIQLSQDELAHGHHTTLKAMAKKMIADDKREIAELEKWMAAMK